MPVLADWPECRDERCFDDDVVIDFPSVAAAVDRIRRAFLADERPAPLKAAIRLSRREAAEGVVVPLELSVNGTCRRCGGRGESWTECCAGCLGSGSERLTHQVKVTVPAGVADGATVRITLTPRHDSPTAVEFRIVVA